MEWGKVPQMPFSGNAGGAWNDGTDRRDEDSASMLQESAAERPRQEDEMVL